MTRENNRPANEINEIIRNALKNNAPVQKIFHRNSGLPALKIGNKSPIIVLPIWAIVRFKKNNYDMNSETHNIIQSHLANLAAQNVFSNDQKGIRLTRNEIENSYILCKDNSDIQLLIETHQIKFENKLYPMDAKTEKLVESCMHELARRKRERDIKFSYAIIVICIAGLAGLIGGAISNYYAGERKKAKVEEKVHAFEKTLPGYLEQKQRVEHFRDSLINAQKGK